MDEINSKANSERILWFKNISNIDNCTEVNFKKMFPLMENFWTTYLRFLEWWWAAFLFLTSTIVFRCQTGNKFYYPLHCIRFLYLLLLFLNFQLLLNKLSRHFTTFTNIRKNTTFTYFDQSFNIERKQLFWSTLCI